MFYNHEEYAELEPVHHVVHDVPTQGSADVYQSSWRPISLDYELQTLRPVSEPDPTYQTLLTKEQNVAASNNFSFLNALSSDSGSPVNNSYPLIHDMSNNSGYHNSYHHSNALPNGSSPSGYNNYSLVNELQDEFSPPHMPVLKESVREMPSDSSYLLGSPNYEVLTNVTSVNTSAPGPMTYNALCLEGTPSSTLAEYHPEHIQSHSSGSYTLLGSQKEKEVNLTDASMYYAQRRGMIHNQQRSFQNGNMQPVHRLHQWEQVPCRCNVCGRGFQSQAKLDSHMLKHTESNSKPFSCEICGKQFKDQGYLKTHTEAHKTGRMFKCSLCGQECLRLNHLKKHLELKHTKDGIFEGKSAEQYTNNEFLNKTMRQKQRRPRLKQTCEYCQAELPNKSAYLVHKKAHLARGEVKCGQCDKVIYNLAYLKMHEKSHGLAKNYCCDLCGKKFVYPNHLKNHMRSHTWVRKGVKHTGIKPEKKHNSLKPADTKTNWINYGLTKNNEIKQSSHSKRTEFPEIEHNRCMICDIKFPSRKQLREHNNKHTLDKETYKCVLCESSFNGSNALDLLRQHMMEQHDKDKPFRCDECDMGFYRKLQLRIHMKVHVSTKPFPCDFCDQSFLKEDKLKLHRALHTGEKPFKCEKCDKGFSSLNSLKQHMINHNDLDVFICKLCQKPLATKADVEDHMSKVHTAEKLLYCSVCNVPFSKMNYLRAHMLKNHKEKVLNGTVKCPKCPEQFLKRSHMKAHLLTHVKEKPFRCDVCGKGFSVSVTLKMHKKKHFDEEGELMNCPVKCGICKKFFKRTHDCQKHQSVHTDVQIYKCDMCEAGFAYPHSLKQHKDTHFEVKPKVKRGRKPKEHTVVKKKISKRKFKCGLCKAKFPNEERLDDHKNTHFDNVDFFKTFECPVCGDGFKKKADLKIHMEVHEDKGNTEQGEKFENKISPDYQCDVCEEVFQTLDELQSHDKVHFCDPSIIKQKLLERSEDSKVETVSRYGRKRFVWRSTHRGRGRGRGSCRGKPRIGYVNKPPEVRLGRRGTGRRKTNFSRRRKFYRGPLRTSARKARFECDRCCSEFQKIKDLKNHLRTHMDEIQCVICKEMFSDSTLFEDHIEGHTENDLSCETCTESFSHFIELQNHIAASHPDVMQQCVPRKNPFYCIICRMTFSHMSHLDAHMLSHNATVRLRRHSPRSENVKISEKKVLLRSVKCEVEDNSEMFGGISSRQEVGSQQVNSTSPVPNTPVTKADVSTGYVKAMMKETKEEEIKVEPFPITRSSKRLIEEKMNFLNGPRRTRSSSVNTKISPEILPVLPPSRRPCNRKNVPNNTKAQNPSRSRQSVDIMSPRSLIKSKSSPKGKSKVKPSTNRNHFISSETLPKEELDSVPDKHKCFKCSVCDEYFAKSSCLENHLIVHSDASVIHKSEDSSNGPTENNTVDSSSSSSKENTLIVPSESSVSEDSIVCNNNSSNIEQDLSVQNDHSSILEKDSTVPNIDKNSILEKDSIVQSENSNILQKDSIVQSKNSSILQKDSTINHDNSSILENNSTVHNDDSSIIENDLSDQSTPDKNLANSLAFPENLASTLASSDNLASSLDSPDLGPTLSKNSCSAESSSGVQTNNSNSPEMTAAVTTETSRTLWRFHLQQGNATTYACVHISNRTAKTCPETYENL